MNVRFGGKGGECGEWAMGNGEWRLGTGAGGRPRANPPPAPGPATSSGRLYFLRRGGTAEANPPAATSSNPPPRPDPVPSAFTPKLVTTLGAGYSRQQFGADLSAGVIVGIVALPLAIAFAIASGVPPERGLYTAIIAGFLISALGGSRVQIGGPTGAFVVVVGGIVAQHGIGGLTIATLMAGVLLVLMGLARLGTVIKFIPYPVVTGFTSGIAVIIFSSQVADLLGLTIPQIPREFFGKWASYLGHLGTLNPQAALLGLATLLLLVFWPRLSKRLPGPFVALVAATAAVPLLGLDVETIGTRFGAIHTGFPPFSLPVVPEATLVQLVGPALTIALLGAVESLLSAVVADGMIGGHHRSSMELVAQGVANIVTPLFGGIPATGAIARTATNIKSGGRTPVAGIVHALVLLLITLFAAPWAARIPLAALAAILVVVAYHMSEWRTFRAELRAPKSDVAVLLTTFGLTVVVDLTVAIAVGMVLAAFLFMKRMAEVASVEAVLPGLHGDATEGMTDDLSPRRAQLPPGVELYEINGPFFFGAAEKFKDALAQVSRRPRALILDMAKVPAMDSTGLRALSATVDRCRHEAIAVLFCDLQSQPRATIRRSGLGFSEAELTLTFDQAVRASEETATASTDAARHPGS